MISFALFDRKDIRYFEYYPDKQALEIRDENNRNILTENNYKFHDVSPIIKFFRLNHELFISLLHNSIRFYASQNGILFQKHTDPATGRTAWIQEGLHSC